MKRGFPLLILATFLWGGNYIAGRILAPAIPAFLLNGVRWVISFFLLWGLLAARKRPLPLFKYWKPLLLLGLIGMLVFSSLTYLGLRSVPAAEAGMISATIPVAILVLSVIVLREKPSALAWLGVILSVVGVLILLGIGRAGANFSFNSGDLALFVAAVSWGLYTVLGKHYGGLLDPLTMTAGAAFYGAIPSAILGLILWPAQGIKMTPVAWVSLFYVSTMASVVAYLVWTLGVHWVGASHSAPFMNLLPIWTVLLGVTLLHEQVTISDGIGGVVTIVGAALTSVKSQGKRKREPHL